QPQDLEQPPEQPAADAPPEEPAAPVEEWYRCLQSAAGRLLAAREVLYPVPIYLIDILLPDAEKPDRAWPDSCAQGVPLNVVASSALLEQLAREQPERFAELRERVAAEQAEVCGGSYVEREDALLPVESQLWNLLKGQAVARELLGNEVRVFARR